MTTLTENETTTVVEVTAPINVEPTEVEPQSVVAHENTPDTQNHCKMCQDVIPPTDKRGRPASKCKSCRDALADEAKERRVTKCVGTPGKGCGRQLRKPTGRGRPSKRCDACKAKMVKAPKVVVETPVVAPEVTDTPSVEVPVSEVTETVTEPENVTSE